VVLDASTAILLAKVDNLRMASTRTSTWIALREYGEGKISLGTLAERLGVPLAEAIDLLSEIGVRSPIEYDEFLRGYAAGRELFKK
jgi:hypothetical protein